MTEIVNREQSEAWNGQQSQSWLDREEQHATASRAHRERLLRAAAVGAGEHVLDVGCGCGETTLGAARATGGTGAAVGVDLSEPMLRRAREHAAAEGLTNATFVRADAQVEPLGEERFDLVMSKFGVMFFADPIAAFTNFASTTRPGGRLAFVSWRPPADNEWIQVLRSAIALGRELPDPPVGAPGMFGLAEPDHVVTVLEAAGYVDVTLEPLDLPFVLGDTDAACGFASTVGVVRAVLDGLEPDDRRRALDELRAALDGHAGPQGVALGSGVWLVTALR